MLYHCFRTLLSELSTTRAAVSAVGCSGVAYIKEEAVNQTVGHMAGGVVVYHSPDVSLVVVDRTGSCRAHPTPLPERSEDRPGLVLRSLERVTRDKPGWRSDWS
jgi:hypothetical protein